MAWMRSQAALHQFNEDNHSNLRFLVATKHAHPADAWQTVKLLDDSIREVGRESELLCALTAASFPAVQIALYG